MPFESLSERFQAAFKKLRGKGKLSEEDVSEALKEMRRALLEADVNFAVTKDFIKKVKEKAVGEEVFGSLNASQTVIKIVRDELTELLAGHRAGSPFLPSHRPSSCSSASRGLVRRRQPPNWPRS